VRPHNGSLEIEIEAPIRGEGLRFTRISEENRPDSVDLLRRVASATEAELRHLSEQDIGALKEFGILVPESSFPRTAPLDLTTDEAGNEKEAPQISFNDASFDLPDIPLRIPAGGRVAWVKDSLREVWFPHVLTPEQFDAAQRLTAGAPPRDLSAGMCEELSKIGILDLSRSASTLRALWECTLAAAKERLDRAGYAIVPSLLPPYLLAVARDYYRHQIAEGFLRFGDEQAGRYFAHREPLAEWLHQQVTSVLTPVLGGRFKPSYSFVSAYVGRAELPRHSDRAQCEVTVSLCVDASPGAERWPLYLESASEGVIVESRLGIGHALIFKGRELPHSRKPLPEGERFLTVLFHFADAAFEGSLD
jgi:hypothetical protein